MKKKILYLFVALISTAFLVSCETEETTFDDTYLIGKWQSGTEFYKYLVDGTGKTWDTSDDVQEDEAQSFTWTLVQSELTHIHVMEIGGGVPKVYTVTELTETSLKYSDDFGKTHSYTKVSN